MKDTYDYLTKIIIVGASGTGKSCILHRFIKGDYNLLSSQTIGVEFSSKVIMIQDIKVKLQLWDTAGQERFRSLTRSYYRGSAGVVLCYDLTRKETLEELHEFIQDVRALTENPSIIIVGNKNDVQEQQVNQADLDQFLNRYENVFSQKIQHLKSSAKNGDNINEIFQLITTDIIRKVENGEIDPENQNCGVQYGDLPNMDFNTINSSRFNTLQKPSTRIIRRKRTTLSLIDRTLDDKNTCSC